MTGTNPKLLYLECNIDFFKKLFGLKVLGQHTSKMVLVNVDKGELSRCTKQYWCILTKEVSRLYVTKRSLGYTSGMDKTVLLSVKLKSIDLVDSIIDFPRFFTIGTFWHYRIGIYIVTNIHMKRNIVASSENYIHHT